MTQFILLHEGEDAKCALNHLNKIQTCLSVEETAKSLEYKKKYAESHVE